MNQLGLFGPIPEIVQTLALHIDKLKRSAKKMGEFFVEIGRGLTDALAYRKNQAFPGFTSEEISGTELVQRAINKLEERYADRQRDLFGQEIAEPEDYFGRREGRGIEAPVREGVPAEAEEGRVSGTRLVEPSEVSEPTFKAPEQKAFDFDEADLEDIAVPPAIPPGQRTRMVTTGYIRSAGNVVRNAGDAACLLSYIRKSAQELAYTITVEKRAVT